MSDSRPDDPTEVAGDDHQQASEMQRSWLRIGVVSIAAMLLLALGMMQATGLVDLLSPFVDSEIGQWLVFVILAVVVGAVAVWSWRTSASR